MKILLLKGGRAVKPGFELHSARAIARTQNHLYLAPHPLLRPWVAHYTFTFPGGLPGGGTLTLIPDASGCILLSPNGDPHVLAWGATTKISVVRRDFNESPVRFFIELLPGALGVLTGIPQEELRDRRFLLGDAEPALAAALETAARRALGADALAEEADRLLLERLCGQALPSAVEGAMARLRETAGLHPVGELASESGYSQRHLSRLFGAAVGMNIKTFARLVRVNAAIQRLRRETPPLTRLAQDAGFYDQAHFIHDFERICGTSPGDYLQNLSVFYNEPFKF